MHFNLIWSDLIWSDLIWSDLIWSDLIWSNLIWSDLIRSYRLYYTTCAIHYLPSLSIIFCPPILILIPYTSLSLPFIGRKWDEWDKLASWFFEHKLAHENVRWLIQIPRLYHIYRYSTVRTQPPHFTSHFTSLCLLQTYAFMIYFALHCIALHCIDIVFSVMMCYGVLHFSLAACYLYLSVCT